MMSTLVITLKRTLLVLFLIQLGACSNEDATPNTQFVRPVKAIQVGMTTELVGKVFPGTAKATKEVNLSFRVSGTLIELPVKKGEKVQVGDIVARLDPRDFEVELVDANSQLANAKASLRNARQEHQRALRIQTSDVGAISQSVIEQRLAAVDQQQAQVNSAKSLVAAAEDKKKYTLLRAPFDGVVVDRYVDNFEDVQAKAEIVRIVDKSHIEMEVSVPENLISYLPYVQNHRVTFDAFPDTTIPATVKEVGTEASPTTRTYQVTLIMQPPAGVDILPGMAGKATGDLVLPDEQKNNKIVIPESAIFPSDDNANTYVWIFDQDSQTVTRRDVQKGKLSNLGVGITAGINLGEWVVTAGVHFLAEGQQVRLLEQQGDHQ
ncbi:MAG: efflux RND transporter periplasmic adaptor subunit [Candidatus Thiodiazotropha sp. (ex Lucinoma borealis)]|nr:efflux RND transporter periplasmic adaptor subunit [Candidatus Thiodiazotropha sp. (ex Lucinoma borealis)]